MTETDLFRAYLGEHAMTVVVEERLRELLSWRRWYRRQANWGHWLDLAEQNDAELRALLRLARKARRITDAAPDPIDMARWERDRQTWTAAS